MAVDSDWSRTARCYIQPDQVPLLHFVRNWDFFSLSLSAPSCVGMARNEWCNQPDEIITFSWSVRDGPDQANKKQKIFVLSHQNLISFFFNLLQTLLHQSFPLFQRMSKLQLKIFVDVKGEERVCMEDFLYVQLIIFSHFPKNVNH